ncbi:uncharacterized protein B0P05DRAFT_459047, partial [Gilbertella persicaria]|uniref:uncharacterized protein n=1 Tax=Gilbertella persicaria TaxID=101096 RepID=UPI00221F08CE
QSTDLQSVITKYHTNPELLKLILASKVEEDKRRTEEAKLKAKELDLYLKNQELSTKDKNQGDRRRSSESNSSSTSSLGSPTNSTLTTNDTLMHRRIAPYAISRPGVMSPRRNSSSLLSMNQLSISGQPDMLSTSAPNPSPQYLYPLPSLSSNSQNHYKTTTPIKVSRRRKSMQAITKIVETTEFPYDDHYFWKNNGNTVQKKTGCRSVYYKCANSCKGCPVNKTVVEQPDGSYVIKYRGDHIPECTKVEHIRDL